MPGREQTLQKLLRREDRDQRPAHTAHSPKNETVNRANDRCPAIARPNDHKNPPTANATSPTIHGTTECKYECPVRCNSTPAADPYAR